MKKKVLEKLIINYYLGKISEEEKKDLEDWYASFEMDEGIIATLSDAERELLENKLLDKIHQNIGPVEEKRTEDGSDIDRPFKSMADPIVSYRYKVAAIFIGVVLLAGLTYRFFQDSILVRSTAYGEMLHITLPDSSTVILNGNSTLRYGDKWFNWGTREVYLEGEAFFSVRHTEQDKKFIVKISDHFNIEVMGTEFNVSKRESGTRIVLNSGKVLLNFEDPQGKAQVTMKPGELVSFKDGPSDYIIKDVNAEVYSSWKDNKLMLDHTSLSEILTVLQESYGLKASVSDVDLLDQKVSGSIPTGKIDMLLKDIAVTYGIKISKNKEAIKIWN